MIPSLDALLAPHDPALLHAAIRERRMAWFRTGHDDLFRALLPWSTFNSLLGSERLLDDRTRMVRRGRDLPREMWSYLGPDMKRVVVPELLQRFCHEGLSIALNQIQHAVPGIAALVKMLEQALPARIGTNVYASFGRESAFRAHHDPHDVLVLHLHGRKRWFGFGHQSAHPPGMPLTDDRLGPVHWEQVLEPGDILYLPRGEIHRASVEGEASLHLTNALLWPRGSDLLHWLAGNGLAGNGLAAGDLDRDIPVYGTASDLERCAEELRATLHRLADSVDLTAFLAAHIQKRQTRPPFNLGLSSDCAPTCWVQPLPAPDLRLPAEGGATIPFNGEEVTLDPDERAVLAALLAGGARQIASLPGPAGLDMERVRDTVARLARRSLVLLTEG
ncbi:MAG: lysine-specific demethylase [Tistrella sp.]|uniref:Lysine-specific demethylase n=1 Tax=Tistrella mobilis TaxID=171437 RepID=A0A3B9IW03_9PROT|nr:lysine-specific demethylase [Tistrella sp.]HAE51399.1 lysine-specific demethylase [Tistrella mobilis]